MTRASAGSGADDHGPSTEGTEGSAGSSAQAGSTPVAAAPTADSGERAGARGRDRVRDLLRRVDRPLGEDLRSRAREVARTALGGGGGGGAIASGPPLLAEGASIGAYRIDGVIGAGGQAVVYRARHRQLAERVVGIKVPHGTSARRMVDEARALASLSHPGIVTLLDLDAESEPPYLVLEHMAGGSLQDRLDAGGPLEPAEALRLAVALLDALAAAHAKGIVHRDLKPENILFDEEGRPAIADFGIGKVVAEGLSLSLTGGASRTGVAGTPLYLAPEQERPGGRIDGRTDLYAFGKLLYHMLTGEPPRTIRPLERDRPGLDPAFSEVVFRLTETDPDARFPDAAATAAALRAIEARLSARAEPDLAEPSQPTPRGAAARGPARPLFPPPVRLGRDAAVREATSGAGALAVPMAGAVIFGIVTLGGVAAWGDKDAWIALVVGLAAAIPCAAIAAYQLLGGAAAGSGLRVADTVAAAGASLGVALVYVGLDWHVLTQHHGATWTALGLILTGLELFFVRSRLGAGKAPGFDRAHEVLAILVTAALAATGAIHRVPVVTSLGFATLFLALVAPFANAARRAYQ